MSKVVDTYGLDTSGTLALADLATLFAKQGVTKAIWKPLSPNDNSKNQPYFGGGFSALHVLPSAELEVVASKSNKPSTKAGQGLIKAVMDFAWIDSGGELYPAPNAKLILYPQYPEVRFSGFLQSSRVSLSQWMDPKKEGRAEGRYLVLGITSDGKVLGYLAVPGSKLAGQLEQLEAHKVTSVFNEFPIREEATDNKAALLHELGLISSAGQHPSSKLYRNADGSIEARAYKAANGGGYTLEALLGIFPNGDSAPDYLGWEVKQYSVSDCAKAERISKAVTLMTPEPDGGDYKQKGVTEFVRAYGYADKQGRPNRMNFGGTHYVGRENASTNLKLALDGFSENGKKFDAGGSIQLLSQSDEVAASTK